MYHLQAEVWRTSAWFAALSSFLWRWRQHTSRWSFLQPGVCKWPLWAEPPPTCFGNIAWVRSKPLSYGLFWKTATKPSLFCLLHPGTALSCEPVCLELKEVVGFMVCPWKTASLTQLQLLLDWKEAEGRKEKARNVLYHWLHAGEECCWPYPGYICSWLSSENTVVSRWSTWCWVSLWISPLLKIPSYRHIQLPCPAGQPSPGLAAFLATPYLLQLIL